MNDFKKSQGAYNSILLKWLKSHYSINVCHFFWLSMLTSIFDSVISHYFHFFAFLISMGSYPLVQNS